MKGCCSAAGKTPPGVVGVDGRTPRGHSGDGARAASRSSGRILGVICPAWLGSRSDCGLAGTGFPARLACTCGLTYRGGAWARSRCGPTRRTYGGGSDCRATSKSCASTGHAARRALPSGRARRSTNQRSSPRGSGVSPAESLTACRRRGAPRGAAVRVHRALRTRVEAKLARSANLLHAMGGARTAPDASGARSRRLARTPSRPPPR
jgi:hypothetical protein